MLSYQNYTIVLYGKIEDAFDEVPQNFTFKHENIIMISRFIVYVLKIYIESILRG